jgi:hypothetical protein
MYCTVMYVQIADSSAIVSDSANAVSALSETPLICQREFFVTGSAVSEHCWCRISCVSDTANFVSVVLVFRWFVFFSRTSPRIRNRIRKKFSVWHECAYWVDWWKTRDQKCNATVPLRQVCIMFIQSEWNWLFYCNTATDGLGREYGMARIYFQPLSSPTTWWLEPHTL